MSRNDWRHYPLSDAEMDRARALWRAGKDSRDIAADLGVQEHEVYRLLVQIRQEARAA